MILLVAGEIASGKTAVASHLHLAGGFEIVSARAALAEMTGADPNDRIELQRRGAEIDRRTAGRWLLEYLRQKEDFDRVVVDSVRTRRQTTPILEMEVDSRLAYLHAQEATRRGRYREASETDAVKASTSFERAAQHPTEVAVRLLRPLAHVVLETDEETPTQIAAAILTLLPDT